MNKIWDESIKMNRLMLLGVAICILFFSLTFYFFKEVSNSRTDDANSRVYEVSEQYKSAIINQINGDFSTLFGVANLISKVDLEDESYLLDRLAKVVEKNGFLRVSYTKLDYQAFMIDNKGNKSYDIDYSQRADIQSAFKGEQHLSSSFEDPITKEYINTYTIPVYIDNELSGVIAAVHKSERFYNIITSSIFGGDGKTNIVDRDGNFVIRLLDEHNNVIDKLDDENDIKQLAANIQNGESNVIDVSINNKEYICATVALGINGWSVNTIVPMGYFHLGYERLQAVFTIAFIAIIAIFSIMFFYIKKMMSESRESIIKLAYYDSLTGMYNRHRYMDVVSELISSDYNYVFVLLDINDFKFINETYGYEGGNTLLRHIANVLNKEMRKGEVSFRDGADRFGMLMYYLNNEMLEARLNNVIKNIASHNFDDFENYNIICNCGIKIIDKQMKNGQDIDIIFDRALLALERAKGNHVSTYVYFNEEMEEQSKKKFQIENQMRSALENHEFQMFLQPKMNIDTGKVIGAEALVRWVVDGEVKYYPDEFIPVFEKNGFICELDLYMLQEACICLKRGIDQGYTMIPISVNQSKVLFYRMNYLDSLKEILDCYQIDPSLIIIEVTETVTMENMDGVKEVIKGLHELGFKVSLDDFGSGYSSLNVLQKLEIDELKLDREFLMNNDHEGKQQKVIESVVGLAKELDIVTVSEGVETSDQLSYLKSIHCDIAQGYLYSKPIPYLELMKAIYHERKWNH